MHRADRHMQELGVFVHGILAGLHALGLAYNWKKKNYVDVACHTGALLYDVSAMAKHLRALDCPDEAEIPRSECL